jgi:hypothetical protein
MNTKSIQQVSFPTLETQIRNDNYRPPLSIRPMDRRRLLLTPLIDYGMTTTTASSSPNIIPPDTTHPPSLPRRERVHGRFADGSLDLISLKFPSLDDEIISDDCTTTTTNRRKDTVVPTVPESFRLSKRRKRSLDVNFAESYSQGRLLVVTPVVEDEIENEAGLDPRVDLLGFFNDAANRNLW